MTQVPMPFADALAPIAALVGRRCAIDGLGGAEPGSEDAGDLEAVVFDWSALSADQRAEVILDFLAEAFLETAPADVDPCTWLPPGLVPFALLGPPGLTERGATWEVARAVDAVLCLDVTAGADGICPVMAWSPGPNARLVEVAPGLAALGLRAAT